MFVPDVNVLIYALHRDFPQHMAAVGWLEREGNGSEAVGVPDYVLSSYVRIATNPRLVAMSITPETAFADCDQFRNIVTFQSIAEGERHWQLFERLVLESGVSGPHITDAYLAAFAMESNATFVTFDKGFTKFRGLRLLEPKA